MKFPIPSTRNLSSLLLLSTAVITPFTIAQRPVFSRQVECPNNPSISGYVSIQALNADMQDELERIQNFRTPTNAPYTLSLCPGETFNTAQAPIRPLLNEVFIICGSTDEESNDDDSCVINGGETQVLIEDSELPGYSINAIYFEGLTFQNFQGTSIRAQASAPTTVTFMNIAWQDFSGAESVITLSGSRSPMTVVVTSSTIQSTTGNPEDASATDGFRNEAGAFIVDDLSVENVQMDTLFHSTLGAETFFTSSDVFGSSLSSVTFTISGARTRVVDVNVAENFFLGTAFVSQLPGSSTNLANTTLNFNDIEMSWIGVGAFEGAELGISNFAMANNNNLAIGVALSGDSTLRMDNSQFVNNQHPVTGGLPNSGLVFASQAQALINRVQMYDNSGYGASIYALSESLIVVENSCFGESNNNAIVVLRDDSEFVGNENYVAPDEVTVACPAPGRRIFTDGGCIGGIDDATSCTAERPEFTNPPTSFFTNEPTEGGTFEETIAVMPDMPPDRPDQPDMPPRPDRPDMPDLDSFSRRVECPTDNSLRGYTSLASLEADMQQELDRVLRGEEPSAEEYIIALCPGTVFPVGKSGFIPILDRMTFICGHLFDEEKVEPCIFEGGGETQILILSSANPGYEISDITFDGITFQNFTTAITAQGSAPTTVEILNSKWMLNENNPNQAVLNLIHTGNAGSDRMSVLIETSDIEGPSMNEVVSENLISNRGGSLVVNDIEVFNVAAANLIYTEGEATTAFSRSTISGLELANVVTSIGGTTEVFDVEISDMIKMNSAFAVNESTMIAKNVKVYNNDIAEPWIIFDAASGSTLSVTESLFDGNLNLQYGIRSAGRGSYTLVEETQFVKNFATIGNKDTALIRSEGGSTQLKSVVFRENADFDAAIYTDGEGAQLLSEKTCWQTNNNKFVIWLGSADVDFFGIDNYVSEDEATLSCNEPGQRVLVADTFECMAGADGSPTCQAELVVPTAAPKSIVPTVTPVPTIPVSRFTFSPFTLYPTPGEPSVATSNPTSVPTTTSSPTSSANPSSSPTLTPVPTTSSNPTSIPSPTNAPLTTNGPSSLTTNAPTRTRKITPPRERCYDHYGKGKFKGGKCKKRKSGSSKTSKKSRKRTKKSLKRRKKKSRYYNYGDFGKGGHRGRHRRYRRHQHIASHSTDEDDPKHIGFFEIFGNHY